MKKLDNILILGIGNNGRQDDGLGWLFLDFLESENSNVDIEYRYQLQIEDADLISKYDTVIFVDATKEDTEHGFYLKPCHPSEKYSFSTHALEPETILYLSHKLYNHNPDASIFTIQGYNWELKIGLSEKGMINLDNAKKYFKDTVLIKYL
jgi:hydrogenase maturation protease